MASRKRIALAVIATGKYDRFLSELWTTARRHFLVDHDVQLFVFSNKASPLPGVRCIPTPHETWPGPTLHRYRSLLAARDELSAADFVFMCDADMRFIGAVGDEILGEVVAVIHPGFYGQSPDNCTYDRNPKSRAYVPIGEGSRYFAGGLQGGDAVCYLNCVEELAARIDDDESRGIMPLWHDESHWNRYLVDHPPQIELSPSYCFPEGWKLPFEPRLIALNKNHSEVRSL